MKKKFVIGIVLTIAFLGVAMMLRTVEIKSKADELVRTQKERATDRDEYKNLIQKYRIEGVAISITTLDELYEEFNSYENVDETIRKNIMAKASDEVLIKFLSNELKEGLKVFTRIEEMDVFSDTLEKSIKSNAGNYIKDVKTKLYNKGKNSYKKVTIITNKYGEKSEIVIEDESENDINTKQKEHLITDSGNMEHIKDYGHSKFSFSYKNSGATATAVFYYTVGGGSLTARYAEGNCKNSLSPVFKFTNTDNYITKSTACGIGQKISGEVKFQCHGLPIVGGGMELGKIRIVMSVEQGREAQHTSLTGMRVYHRAKIYGQDF